MYVVRLEMEGGLSEYRSVRLHGWFVRLVKKSGATPFSFDLQYDFYRGSQTISTLHYIYLAAVFIQSGLQ